MVIILVWEVFRWLMSHLAYVAILQFNGQVVENAELMVRLALKDRQRGIHQEEEHYSVAAPVGGQDHSVTASIGEQEPRPGKERRTTS